jgi:hypothetical protein
MLEQGRFRPETAAAVTEHGGKLKGGNSALEKREKEAEVGWMVVR